MAEVQHPRRVRALLTALAVPAFALGIAVGAAELVDKPVLPPTGQPASIMWGDRVYSSPRALAKWLHARGTTYHAWARKHPESAAILAGRSVRTRARAHRAAAPSSAESTDSAMAAVALLIASVAGIALFVVAVRARFAGIVMRRGGLRLQQRPRLKLKPPIGDVRRAAAAIDGGARQLFFAFDRARSRGRPRVVLPEAIRYRTPDIAFTLMSVLLAIVLAASVALYLN